MSSFVSVQVLLREKTWITCHSRSMICQIKPSRIHHCSDILYKKRLETFDGESGVRLFLLPPRECFLSDKRGDPKHAGITV